MNLPILGAMLAALPAALVSILAYLSGQLSRSGVVAATFVGWFALMAGWRWGVFLLSWFVVMAIVSRAGRGRKRILLEGVIEKSGSRDATQVLANGGIFAIAGLLTVWTQAETVAHSALVVVAFTALISAGADTAATEIGTLYGGQPWSLKTRRIARAGTSGAISFAGSIAALSAAVMFSTLAFVLTITSVQGALAITIGAICAVATDSILGAWCQSERWCAACNLATEQKIHRCGESTIPAGGFEWLDNDAVNAISGAIGAAVALGVWAVLGDTSLVL